MLISRKADVLFDSTSIASILTKRYNNNGSLSVFRKFQRTELKLGKAKLDITFLKKCKQHDAIPRFLYFKLANRRLQNSTAYRQCQRRLLDEEINIKRSRIRELTSLHSNLANLVSSIDLIHFKSLVDSENSKKLSQLERVQDKKLLHLRIDSKASSTIDPDKVIFNYSSRRLSDKEKAHSFQRPQFLDRT